MNSLQFRAMGINQSHEAVELASETNPVDKIITFYERKTNNDSCFLIIVNNKSGYDLQCTQKNEYFGKWPLGDKIIKNNHCVGCGLHHYPSMSFAVQYTAASNGNVKHTIALAASWPPVGKRKIAIFEGKSAKHAWNFMKKVQTIAVLLGIKVLLWRRKIKSFTFLKLCMLIT